MCALPPSRSSAEDRKPREVYSWDVSGYRYEDVQSGDWVEYRTVISRNAKEEDPVFLRLACVKRGKTTSRIERNEGRKKFWKSATTLYRVCREHGSANAAWWAKAGDQGEGVVVTSEFLSAMPGEGSGWESSPKTATVSRETIEIAGKSLDCEKIELVSDAWFVEDGKKTDRKATTRQTSWYCKDVPFPVEPMSEKERTRYAWTGKPAWEGGLARERLEGPYRVHVVDLTGFGHDATPSIRVK